MATKKAAGNQGAGTKTASRKPAAKSMPKAGKNPAGGLTAEGRAYFAATQGSHLQPGVTGAADTPEKMRRKGSFLTRMFTHPRGPMLDEKGEPTRLALSAHAWGEPVPKTEAAASKLAAKGRKLLEQYHAADGDKAGAKSAARKKPAAKKPARKSAARKSAAKTSVVKTSPSRKSPTRKTSVGNTAGA